MSAEVLGFSGAMHSGKTTAASALREVAEVPAAHIEYSGIISGTAARWLARVPGHAAEATPGILEELRTTVHEEYGIPLTPHDLASLSVDGLSSYLRMRSDLDPAAREVTAESKEMHREVLRWLGHQMCTVIDPHFWTRAVGAQIADHQNSGAQLITIGGVRFPWDVEMIHEVPGSIIEVVRPGIGAVGRPEEGGLDATHIDATVHNDGGPAQLKQKMHTLWTDAQAGRLSTSY